MEENILKKEELKKYTDKLQKENDYIIQIFIEDENENLYYLKNNEKENVFFKQIFIASFNQFIKNLSKKESSIIEKYDDSIFDKKYLYINNKEIDLINDIKVKIETEKYLEKYKKEEIYKIEKYKLIIKIIINKTNEYILGFQHLRNSEVFKNKKILGFLNEKLVLVSDKFLLSPKDYFDYITFNKVTLIKSLYYFESDFGYYQKYKEEKNKLVKIIKNNNNILGKDITLKGIDEFEQILNDKPLYLKKLYRIIKKDNYNNFEFNIVKKVIKEFDLKINIMINEKIINLYEKTNYKDFLDLFNELYYKSELSGKKMVASESNNYK